MQMSDSEEARSSSYLPVCELRKQLPAFQESLGRHLRTSDPDLRSGLKRDPSDREIGPSPGLSQIPSKQEYLS